jgi:antitoxin (DNA-binding transcriptional repressor) of toxin-antitoxin stability system
VSETTIPVAEAARDFLRLLERVERLREPAVLMRDGRPVASLNPLPTPVLTCAELAERWPSLERLPPEEAAAFANDLEQSHASLPPLKPAWD